MNEAAIDTTWLNPIIRSRAYETRQDRVELSQLRRQELHAFLSQEIETSTPDKIIVVERRGTAILRALKESESYHLDFPWANVISSSVIEQVPGEFYPGMPILIFDDMKKGGSHIRRVIEKLTKMDPTKGLLRGVRVAVFAMHEDANSGSEDSGSGVAHTWFYRGLSTPAYRNIRLSILSMLQSAGSLMLDTEHLEVRVRLKRPFPSFLEALGRRADVIPFHSLGGRRNVAVVFRDNDTAHTFPDHLLPLGAKTTDIVKKCRIIERGQDEYSIIPICYPSLPKKLPEWPKAPIEIFGNIVMSSGEATFYVTALVAALHVLEWTLKALYAAGEGLVDVILPIPEFSESDSKACSLNHLKVMYPTVNLDGLSKLVAMANKKAQEKGAKLRGHPVEVSPPIEVTSAELRRRAWQLLQVVRAELDQRIAEKRLFDAQWPVPHPFGLSAREIFDLAERFGWPRVVTSALFDILIDDGHLVTCVDFNLREQCWERVFEPDGEMVSELVRLYTTQRGLPGGF